MKSSYSGNDHWLYDPNFTETFNMSLDNSFHTENNFKPRSSRFTVSGHWTYISSLTWALLKCFPISVPPSRRISLRRFAVNVSLWKFASVFAVGYFKVSQTNLGSYPFIFWRSTIQVSCIAFIENAVIEHRWLST